MELDLNAASYQSLGRRLEGLHEQLLEVAPDVERIACALYDAGSDLLTTFINSTREGEVLRSYQYKLSDSDSLSRLAATGSTRTIDDIATTLQPSTAHSAYVLREGYLSSFTIPMSHRGDFLGFLFFDSRKARTFTPALQRELTLYGSIITMAVANELAAVRSMVGALALARDFAQVRDAETGAHLERIARYARLVTSALVEPLGLDDEWVQHVFLYAPMHDIGKIGIPDRILLKPGRLDPDEWEVMKTHTTIGRAMVENVTADLGLSHLPDDTVLLHIVELHHERMDGSGYPHGLAGEDIPLEARIVAVADVFDALTSHRPYKRAWTFDESVAELSRMAAAGTLDPQCVAALEQRREEAQRILDAHPEPPSSIAPESTGS